MIFYLLNYYGIYSNRIKILEASSVKTLLYLLHIDKNIICINYQLKRMIYRIYSNYIYKKYKKNIIKEIIIYI